MTSIFSEKEKARRSVEFVFNGSCEDWRFEESTEGSKQDLEKWENADQGN